MRSNRHEVVVVGAGPAGSSAALHLAQRGHDVVLVDKSKGPRCRIVCTGIVGREAYEKLDLPCDPVIDTIDRARFFSPSGVEVSYEPRAPMGHVVDRVKFDAALTEQACDAGATLLRGYTARGIETVRDGLKVILDNGEYRSLHARALVVATGYQRRLHNMARLGRAVSYINGVSADLPFADLDAAELYFGNQIAPGFFAWAVPYGSGKARLGVLTPNGGKAFFRKFLEMEPIRSRLRTDFTEGGIDLIQRRMMSRGIVQGTVQPSYSDRVLAVGEAAGQIKTTTSGGIYYGMIGAGIAAEVLSTGLRKNRLSSDHLSTYETAWKARLGGEIDAGFELQRMGGAMSDPEIDELFTALNSGLGPAVRVLIQFDWHQPALRALLKRRASWRLGSSVKTVRGKEVA